MKASFCELVEKVGLSLTIKLFQRERTLESVKFAEWIKAAELTFLCNREDGRQHFQYGTRDEDVVMEHLIRMSQSYADWLEVRKIAESIGENWLREVPLRKNSVGVALQNLFGLAANFNECVGILEFRSAFQKIDTIRAQELHNSTVKKAVQYATTFEQWRILVGHASGYLPDIREIGYSKLEELATTFEEWHIYYEITLCQTDRSRAERAFRKLLELG